MRFLLRKGRKRVIIRNVRELVQKKARFFVGASLAALAVRLFLVWRFPAVVDDSRFYADIAKNWLHHGIYGVTDSGVILPTLARLPGYPGFLAAMFGLFGDNNFRAVLLVQTLFDLATCFLIADMARRLFSERAAQAAFLLAALCPFFANYAAAALTEALAIFSAALALNLALRGLGVGAASVVPNPARWSGRHSLVELAAIFFPAEFSSAIQRTTTATSSGAPREPSNTARVGR